MPITYQTKLKEWCDKGRSCKKSIDSDITDSETNYSISFPQSYKEFLSISGEYFVPFTVLSFKDWLIKKDFNTLAVEWLKDANIDLEKPYWVFGEDQGVLYFFYLDEGDDPPVYIVEMDYYHENPSHYLRQTDNSFSKFIEKKINYYEKNKQYLK